MFNCISTCNEHILEKEFCVLLCDILHFPFTTTDIHGINYNHNLLCIALQYTSELPIFPVTFENLLSWVIKFKTNHPFKQESRMKKFLESFSRKDIPISFIIRFMEYRSVYYDIIYNINKFEQVNKQLTCSICGKYFALPYIYIKHIVICKRMAMNNQTDNKKYKKEHHHKNHIHT